MPLYFITLRTLCEFIFCWKKESQRIVEFENRKKSPEQVAGVAQGKSPRNPLDRRLGGPRSRSGCGCEEKNSQPLPGIKP
jgi:hypothetical protein